MRPGWLAAHVGLVAVAGVGLGFGLVAAVDRASPRVEIRGVTYRPAYHPGETFHGQWSMVYTRACEGRVVRWLTTDQDPDRAVYLPDEEIRPVLRPQEQLPRRIMIEIAPFDVPYLPPGPAAYHVRFEAVCNWLQELLPSVFSITVDYPVIPFGVLPPKPVQLGQLHPGLRR